MQSAKLVVTAAQEAEIVQRLTEDSVHKHNEMLRALQEREEERERRRTGKLEISAKSRELAARDDNVDIVTRLLEYGSKTKEKRETLREEKESKEMLGCGEVSIDEHSKLLASKWVEQQEQGVNSANCQVSFVTGLRDNKALASISPIGGSCKQNASTKSSKSLTSSSSSNPVPNFAAHVPNFAFAVSLGPFCCHTAGYSSESSIINQGDCGGRQ